MTLALFDLDNTLLQVDSDYEWGQFLVRKGLVDAETYAATNREFYEHYKNGTLDIHAYAAFTQRVLSEHDRTTLDEWHRDYMRESILPMISPKSRALVEQHRQQGHTLMVITATNSFVTGPIVAALGIEHLLAINPKMANGRFTREIDGVPTFREGKVIRLQDWLKTSTETLKGSYFYSDSHNDLPLLEMVDYPVAVDPDDRLRARAEQEGWPVISLRG